MNKMAKLFVYELLCNLDVLKRAFVHDWKISLNILHCVFSYEIWHRCTNDICCVQIVTKILLVFLLKAF